MKLYLEITMRSGREINTDPVDITEEKFKEVYPSLKPLMRFKELGCFQCIVDGYEMFLNPNEIESVTIVKE